MTSWMSAGAPDEPHVGLPMVQLASIAILAAFSDSDETAGSMVEAFVAEVHAMSHASAHDLSMAALCTSGIMTGDAARRTRFVCGTIDEGPMKASARLEAMMV